jgi:Tol biopolymer transport system component
MAPEQLEGRPTDERTDIFAFGVLFYEMLTGRHAFDGSSDAAVIGNILHADPPAPSSIERLTPAALDDIVRSCLAKDPNARCQSIADVRSRLTALSQSIGSRSRPRNAKAIELVVAALLMGVVSAAWWTFTRTAPPTQSTEQSSTIGIHRLTLTGDARYPAISPDGKFVAFERQGAVWLKQVSALNDVEIASPVVGRRYRHMTFTPDGAALDYVAVEKGIPQLWRIPLLGGAPTPIARNVWSAVGWSPDGKQLAFVRTDGRSFGETSLIVANADGSQERVLATRSAAGSPPRSFYNGSFPGFPASRPAWSPDGKSILAVGVSGAEPDPADELIFLSLADGTERQILPIHGKAVTEALWLDKERLLVGDCEFAASGISACQLSQFELGTGKWTPVTRDRAVVLNLDLTVDRRTAVATRSERRTGIWVGDATGAEPKVVVPETAQSPQRPVVDSTGAIWYVAVGADGVGALYRLPSGGTRPTFVAHKVDEFAVTPDSRTVVFRGASGRTPLYRVNSDGSGLLPLVEQNAAIPAISPDGQTVFFAPYTPYDRGPGLMSVALSGGTPRRISDRKAFRIIEVSPNGSRLLFDTEKPSIVCVCELPDCGNPRDYDLRGGSSATAKWTSDGSAIAYVNPGDQRNVWALPLDGAHPYAITHLDGARIQRFAWSPDGKRLVMSRGGFYDDVVLLSGLR